MEPSFGRALEGLANVVSNKWFAAMGLVGLILFATSLVIALPGDPVVARYAGLIMMGWGFGLAECRYVREVKNPAFRMKQEVWRFSASGVLLFAIAGGAAIGLALHLI